MSSGDLDFTTGLEDDFEAPSYPPRPHQPGELTGLAAFEAAWQKVMVRGGGLERMRASLEGGNILLKHLNG